MNAPSAQEISQALDGVSDATLDPAIELLGMSVDGASDLGDVALLRRCIEALEERAARDAASRNVAVLYYFLGNAWSSLRHLRHRAADEAIWEWDGDEHGQELLALRRATRVTDFAKMPAGFQVRVLTNLGNVLNNIGRIVESLECFDRALALDKGFGMAKGNKGIALETYARWAYDDGHQHLLMSAAASLLQEAASLDLEAPGAAADFAAKAAFLRKYCPDSECLSQLNEGESCTSEAEEAYRTWCLENRLFLHPINDMGGFPAVAHDPLLLPKVTAATELGSAFHGFYNQLKQEYASARWLMFTGLLDATPDFVDDVKLLDTLDETALGNGLEQVKLALRSAYSLFDKIAAFVNERWELGQRINYFRWFWYQPQSREEKRRRAPRVLRSDFAGMENAPLRALYWLAKDLADDRDQAEHHEGLDPDAQRIAQLRNKLEHGYVKVQFPDATEVVPDPLAYRITTDELVDKTLRVLKLSRAALVYLCLAVHRQEQLREELDPEQVAPVGPLPVLGENSAMYISTGRKR